MDIQSLCDTPPWAWPADADRTLLDVLPDRAAPAEERRRAASLASSVTVMNEEIAEALLAILQDPSEPEELRAQAAISMGPTLDDVEVELDWEDPDDLLVSEQTWSGMREALHETYLDAGAPKLVRRKALEASVRAQADWHAGAVRAAYHGDDPEWRITAVFCMAYVADFDDEILEALESRDPALFFEAVRAAGARGLKKAWRRVNSILQRERNDRPLLLAAIAAVPEIRPESAHEALAELLDHPDAEISEAADEALGMADATIDEDAEGDDDW
jgi:hypothetical protein